MLCITANSSYDALNLLSSEPLRANGGIADWTVLQLEMQCRDGLDNDVQSPTLIAACTIPLIPPPHTPAAAALNDYSLTSRCFGLSLDCPVPPPLQTLDEDVHKGRHTVVSAEDLQCMIAFLRNQTNRICSFGLLRRLDASRPSPPPPFVPLDNKEEEDPPIHLQGDEVGFVAVFNSKSNADAIKFVNSFPNLTASPYQQTVSMLFV